MKEFGVFLALVATLLMFVPLCLSIAGVMGAATAIMCLGVSFILSIAAGALVIFGK